MEHLLVVESCCGLNHIWMDHNFMAVCDYCQVEEQIDRTSEAWKAFLAKHQDHSDWPCPYLIKQELLECQCFLKSYDAKNSS